MVRTYWLVPGFNEASGNLDQQPFARIDHVEACRPRAWCASNCSLSGSGQAMSAERPSVRIWFFAPGAECEVWF